MASPSGGSTTRRGAAVMIDFWRCIPGLLILLMFSCSNRNEGSADASVNFAPAGLPERGAPPLDQHQPYPLELAEAKCKWPCDAAGCAKARNTDEPRCVIPCKADSECPPQSFCVCDNDKCSLAPRHILGFKASPGVASCFPLLEGMADMIADCRRYRHTDAGCGGKQE